MPRVYAAETPDAEESLPSTSEAAELAPRREGYRAFVLVSTRQLIKP